MKTWKLILIIYFLSVSLRKHPNPRGQRVLVILYSELARRYDSLSPLPGTAGNPYRK